MKKIINCIITLGVLLTLTACSNPTNTPDGQSGGGFEDVAILPLSLESSSEGVIINLDEIPANVSEIEIYAFREGENNPRTTIKYTVKKEDNGKKQITDIFVQKNNNYEYGVYFLGDDGLVARTNLCKVTANGGKGEIKIKNEPVADYDANEDLMTFTTFPTITPEIQNFITDSNCKNYFRAWYVNNEFKGFYPTMSKEPFRFHQYDWVSTKYKGQTLQFFMFEYWIYINDLIYIIDLPKTDYKCTMPNVLIK